MKLPPLKPEIVPGYANEPPVLSLRSIVRKSTLLNVVIVLTSFPVLIFEGGPKAVVPTLEIMAGITVLVWTATFALFSLVSLPRLFRPPVSSMSRHDPPPSVEDAGVADRWLDGPI
jgi:hypothetical protein